MTVGWPQGIEGWGRLICGRGRSPGRLGWGLARVSLLPRAHLKLLLPGEPREREGGQGVPAFPGEQGLTYPHPYSRGLAS